MIRLMPPGGLCSGKQGIGRSFFVFASAAINAVSWIVILPKNFAG